MDEAAVQRRIAHPEEAGRGPLLQVEQQRGGLVMKAAGVLIANCITPLSRWIS
jgi:hypothetical protein